MNISEAIRILHPDTTREEIRRIEESGKDAIKEVEDACLFACETMEDIKKMKIGDWISCKQRMPENEVDVLIAFSVGDTKCHIAMAFYEDGTKTTEESDYWWNDIDNFEYSEKDRCFFIPEGWWESVTFSDEFKPVDREVVAWMPLPEPCKAR